MGIELENETILKKKETILETMSTLNKYEIEILEEVVTKEAGLKSLIFSTSALAVIRNNELLKKNKKTVMLKAGNYDENGRRIGEDFEPYNVPLDTSDIKEVIESTDKASITLGLNQRHAPRTEIQNTNATQVNTEIVGYGVKKIED